MDCEEIERSTVNSGRSQKGKFNAQDVAQELPTLAVDQRYRNSSRWNFILHLSERKKVGREDNANWLGWCTAMRGFMHRECKLVTHSGKQSGSPMSHNPAIPGISQRNSHRAVTGHIPFIAVICVVVVSWRQSRSPSLGEDEWHYTQQVELEIHM